MMSQAQQIDTAPFFGHIGTPHNNGDWTFYFRHVYVGDWYYDYGWRKCSSRQSVDRGKMYIVATPVPQKLMVKALATKDAVSGNVWLFFRDIIRIDGRWDNAHQANKFPARFNVEPGTPQIVTVEVDAVAPEIE